MGLARVNLTAKRFDFWAIGPAVQLPVGARPVSFSLAPDRKRAYGLLQEIGRYEFWTFDVPSRAGPPGGFHAAAVKPRRIGMKFIRAARAADRSATRATPARSRQRAMRLR